MKTQKTTKRLLGLVLIMMLVISLLPLNALAAELPKASIMVSGGEENSTVVAYRLIDVSFDTATNSPQEPMYQWNSAVADWVSGLEAGKYIGTDNAVTDAFLQMDAAALAAFFDEAAARIRQGLMTPQASGSQTVDSSGNATIANLDMGGYLVLVENGINIYRPSSANLIPVWDELNRQWKVENASLQLKHSTPGITKKIKEAGGLVDVSHASIGGTVTYDVVVDVPQYPSKALAKIFSVGDNLPAQLKLDGDSIKVFGVKPSTPEVNLTADNSIKQYYQQSTSSPGSKNGTFVLTFDQSKVSDYQQLHITYTAQLQAAAVPGDAYTNTAFLEYSNNPYEEGSYKVKEDDATVYTFGIALTKEDEKTQAGLKDAKFSVADNQDNSDPLSFIKVTEGVYRCALPNEVSAVTELVTADAGKLEITGLKPGTWYLTETEAPGGYVKLSTPVTAVLADEDRDGKLDNSEPDLNNTLSVYQVTVTNRQGFSLPKTGGIGTILFSAGGVVLAGMGVAIIFLYLQKKRRA